MGPEALLDRACLAAYRRASVRPGNLTQTVLEQEMQRLFVLGRLLSALLLALAVHGLVGGFTILSGMSAVLVAVLLVVATCLIRQGRRFQGVVKASSEHFLPAEPAAKCSELVLDKRLRRR